MHTSLPMPSRLRRASRQQRRPARNLLWFSSFSLHGLLNLASRNQGHRPDLAVARSAPSYDQHLTFPGNTPCVVAKRKTPGIVGAESGGSGVLLRYTGYPPSRSDTPIGEEKGGTHMCRKA